MSKALVSITAESKFMQNFMVASGVNPGAGIVSIANAAKQTEFFTIGSDGTVYNYYPDPTSDTGYSGISLGISATTIGVTTNAGGAIVIFAANTTTLTMVTEQFSQAQRWSAPVPLTYPQPNNAQMISAIFPTLVGSTVYAALLITVKATSPGAVYALVMGTLPAAALPSFALAKFTFSSLNCVWMGASINTLAFACVDQVIVTVAPATLVAQRLPMVGSFSSKSVTAVLDKAANSQIFAVLNDGNAYQLLAGGGSYSWGQITQSQNLRSIAATLDAAGAIHLLTVGANARLAHMPPDSAAQSGFAAPVPVMSNVGALALTLNDAGQIEGFAASSNGSQLTHVIYQQASSDWQMQPVEVQQGSEIVVYSSYGTDVTVYNTVGAPLGETGVTIWSSESSVLTINGAVFFVGPNRVAQVTTNPAGMLNIQQQTGSLAVPVVLMTVPGIMAPGDTLSVTQDANTQSDLAGLTGPQLYAATTASGTPVLPSQYRTQQEAAAVAQAVAQSMQIGLGTVALAPAASAGVKRARPGVATLHQTALLHLRHIDPTARAPIPHWRFRKVGGHPVFEVLTADTASAHIVAAHATGAAAALSFDFFDEIGDLVSGVTQGIINVVDTVVTAVAGGVQAVITFVVDGVQYIYDTIVTTVEQAFDLVELVFAQVQVFFETLFEWLGFIFNWADMTRTAQSLTYTVNQFLGFLSGSAGGMQTYVDANFQALAKQVDAMFDQAIQDVGGSATIGGYADANEPDDPAVTNALSNNPMYNMLLDNSGAMKSSSPLALLGGTALATTNLATTNWAAMSTQFDNFAVSTEANPNFTAVDQFFTTLGGSINNLFSALFSALLTALKALVDAVIAGTQALVDLLLQAVGAMISAIQASLNAEWDIPVLSPLFAWATNGMPLTTLNLIAMIFAVPGTVLYKIVFSAAPFPSDAALGQFESSFTTATMLAASGFAPQTGKALSARAELAASGGLLPESMAGVLILLGGVTGYFNAGLTAVCDGIPGADDLAPLSIASFVCSVAGQAASFPWFYDSGSVGCADPVARNNLLWTYGCFGLLIDVFYQILEQQKIEVPGDVQSVISHIYGDIEMVLAALASNGASGADIAAKILSPLPDIAKLLKLKAVVAATEGISLPVLAAIDALCLVTASTIDCVEGIIGLEDQALLSRAA